MSMLARYKKQGGMIELVKLIESSSEPKKSSLLNMVRTEDPNFAAEVEAKICTFDRLKTLQESYLAEIVAATPPKFLALALHNEDPEFVKLCEKCLGKNFADFKAEKENLSGTTVAQAQIESGQRKMISEARKLEAAGQIKLGQGAVGAPVSPTPTPTPAATNASAGISSAAAAPSAGGAATSQNPLSGLTGPESTGTHPPLESFGIEVPPAGLIGERLEKFIKQNIGI